MVITAVVKEAPGDHIRVSPEHRFKWILCWLPLAPWLVQGCAPEWTEGWRGPFPYALPGIWKGSKLLHKENPQGSSWQSREQEDGHTSCVPQPISVTTYHHIFLPTWKYAECSRTVIAGRIFPFFYPLFFPLLSPSIYFLVSTGSLTLVCSSFIYEQIKVDDIRLQTARLSVLTAFVVYLGITPS